MAYTTINKSTDYFNTKLYTGDGTSSNSITGVGFAPDFLWSKARNGANAHILVDKVRGATKVLHSNATTAEQTCNANQDMISLDSDGFTVGTPTQFLGTNTNGRTVASWNWRANGAGSANTDGSITSTVSTNTTAGFSISTYTGNGSAGATVGHGLGVTPNIVIIKRRSSSEAWAFWSSSLAGNTSYLRLNATDAVGTASDLFNSTTPSNSLVTLGTGGFSNSNTETYVMYCFAEKTGYSKFGSYTGNGNANGTFIYTGFKPNWTLIKRTDSADDWSIWDNKRNINGYTNYTLQANTPEAEWSDANFRHEFLSNGFKLRNSFQQTNASGGNYIYMAFGQSLVGSNNIPCTAR